MRPLTLEDFVHAMGELIGNALPPDQEVDLDGPVPPAYPIPRSPLGDRARIDGESDAAQPAPDDAT